MQGALPGSVILTEHPIDVATAAADEAFLAAGPPPQMSTSALLRQVQVERDELARTLAGAQAQAKACGDALRQQMKDNAALAADLTRVVGERDGVRDELARLAGENEDVKLTLAMRDKQLREAGEQVALLSAELVSARTELVQLRDLTGHLRDELNRLRSWQVFRGGEQLVCAPCGGEIERGQAVEPLVGSENDDWQHVHCPRLRAEE